MSEKNSQKMIPSQGGIIEDLALRLKLIFKLMGDTRVSPLLKALPVGTLLYFIIPDLFVGPIDDMAVVWLGSYLFVELCPPEVVKEHAQKLTNNIPTEWFEPLNPDEDIIDGEFREDRD